MNVCKRALCIILLLMLLIAASGVSASTADDAFELVCALGVMNSDEDFIIEKEAQVTFEQFTALVSQLVIPGFRQTMAGENPADDYKNFVLKYGFVTELAAKSGQVTYGDLLYSILSVLGYKDIAEFSGGFPVGYLQIASRLSINLTKGINENITGNEAAAVLYRALDAEIMEQVLENETVKHKTEGFTLADRFSIKTTTGLVEANNLTGVYGIRVIQDSKVRLDGKDYLDSSGLAAQFIGLNVKAWYREDEYNPEILYLRHQNKNCETLTLSPNQLADVGYTSKGTVLSYLNNDKVKQAIIAPTARMLFNSVFCSNALLEDSINKLINTKNGSLRIVDMDGNGVFDFAEVKYYDVYVVKSVSNKIVSFKNSDAALNLDDREKRFVSVAVNGKESAVSDLKENDIIHIYTSLDEMVVRVEAVRSTTGTDAVSNKAEGRLISLEDSEGLYGILDIDGLRFETTVDFWQRNKSSLTIGNQYVFYLDASGRIAWNSNAESGERYGFLLAAGGNGGMLDKTLFKILTADNKITIFESASVLQLYEGDKAVRIRSFEELKSNELLFDTARNLTKRQLIKYFIDDWGKLSRVFLEKTDFSFLCVPATEIMEDGTMKTNTRSDEYKEEDFILDKVQVIDPMQTDIYVNKPRSQGGMVPVGIVPHVYSEPGIALRKSYANYDIGKYIADDKSFGFIKLYPDVGIGRNSLADKSDELKNTPGKIHSLAGTTYASIDTRYMVLGSTIIFKIAGEGGEDSNIYKSFDADESIYQVVPVGSLPYGGDGRKTSLLELFDVQENYTVPVMTLIDISTVPNGEDAHTINGVVSRAPSWGMNADGVHGLQIPLYYRGAVKTYFCANPNITDQGYMMRYFDENNNAITPSSLLYYGDGAVRKGRYYTNLRGMYEGKGITSLKAGDVVRIKVNRNDEIVSFITLFDGDCSREYYEDEPSDKGNNFGGINVFSEGEKEFPYGNYTNYSIAYNQSLVMSPRNFIYGEVKTHPAMLSETFFHCVVKTCLPFWSHRDRVGTNNGSHEQLYREENGNTFLPVERSREIHRLTDVVIVNQTQKTLEKSSISAILPGDRIVMISPQYNSVGQIIVYREY